MAVVKKISELTPKGENLAATDLIIVGVDNGVDYDLKSCTGAELLSTAVSQTITNGITTSAPSENAVYDALDLKVDKVAGSRLITSAEGAVLGNTSGTNTGDQDLSGYQLISGKNASNGYVGITDDVITLPLGRGFVSNNVTPNQIAYFDNSGNLLTLSISTYPSLTELSYVKGAASNIQNQLNNKVNLNSPLITPATKTKITYDAKGLITAGDDATKVDYSITTQSVVSAATVTPTFSNDIVTITAQAVNLTLANPTGTIISNSPLMIRIKDNGTPRTITFDTQYRAIGITLPTTTTANKTMYLGMIYNATDTKWDIIGYNQEV